MSKSKKAKKPNIDLGILARPRLEALLSKQAQQTPDLDALEKDVRALMQEIGEGPIIDALVKRIEGAPEAEREMLMDLVIRLKSAQAIEYLWQRVKKTGGLSIDAKITAMTMLKAMGEDVDINDPGRYISAREIKATDLKSLEDMVRMGLHGLARGLRATRDAAEVEAYMHRIQQMPQEAKNDTSVLLDLVEQAEADRNDLGADFIYAMALTTPFPEVQQAAKDALTRLEIEGVKPVTPAILNLGQDHFHAAYSTDPGHPWQQSVVVGWQRSGGSIQAISFLMDFGLPWAGAIKDMFVTHGMTPREFDYHFKTEAAQKMGQRVYQISLARAQAMVTQAIQKNEEHKIAPPKEYAEVRHLVERWVLHPPIVELKADRTKDELGNQPLAVQHETQPLFLSDHDLENPAVRKWLEEQGDKTFREPAEEMSEEDSAREKEILEHASFPPPVKRLLDLGEPAQAKWRDYRKEGIRKEHIPDLIRMATDRELNTGPMWSKLVWGPVHAWRALGQLGASEAIGPLIGLLRYIDEEDEDWISGDLPIALGMIGRAALPELDAHLKNPKNLLYARVAAADAIKQVGKNHPETRSECIAILTRALEQYHRNDPTLNGFILSDLLDLHAVEATGIIEQAFAANRIDEEIAGDWQDVQIELGLEPTPAKRKQRR